jgi:membrane-associated protein
MSTLLPYLINWLQEYSYPALWLVIYVASVGVPLPIALLLLAAGAFAGLNDFNIILLALIAISASVCGDNTGYFIGRLWGSKVVDWLQTPRGQRFISPQTVVRARAYFVLRGGWAIFLSRFLFSAFGGVINLVAGSDRYPYRRFLLYDIAGETLGAIMPLLLGYLFGASWEAIGDLLGATSTLVLALFLVIVFTSLLVRMLKRSRARRIALTLQSIGPIDETMDQEIVSSKTSPLLP